MYSVTGTWTEAPTTLEVTFPFPLDLPVSCPRIADMAAGFAYRVAP